MAGSWRTYYFYRCFFRPHFYLSIFKFTLTMVFNSYTFILFFGLVLLLHYLPFSWKTKKINLLVASYIFYAAWNPPFIILLWISTVVDYLMALALSREENKFRRKVWLIVSLTANLGMLGFFKYGGFLLDTFTSLA